MKISAVAYIITFLLPPPFFVHSLAEPDIGERKSFTTANVQHVVVENSKDLENEHRLLQSGTCSNGLPGIERNAVCCPLGCGTCGGQGCRSRARSVGLTEYDCCINRILDSGLYCSSEGAAPCIIDEEGAPTPAPTPPAPTPAPVASSVPSDMQTLLDLHNEARCVHNAEPLVYSEEVEVTAQVSPGNNSQAPRCFLRPPRRSFKLRFSSLRLLHGGVRSLYVNSLYFYGSVIDCTVDANFCRRAWLST